jgi:hypothetical protein
LATAHERVHPEATAPGADGVIETKTCNLCHESLPANLDHFYKWNTKSGLSSRCKPCTRKKKAESSRKIAEQDPGWRIRRRGYVKQYKERHPERVREQDRRRNLKLFGITPEQYDTILDEQGGVCRLCERPPGESRKLAIDHDHECCEGKRSCGDCIRGLLCGNCNTALGLVGDDTELLAKMIEYIKEFR